VCYRTDHYFSQRHHNLSSIRATSIATARRWSGIGGRKESDAQQTGTAQPSQGQPGARSADTGRSAEPCRNGWGGDCSAPEACDRSQAWQDAGAVHAVPDVVSPWLAQLAPDKSHPQADPAAWDAWKKTPRAAGRRSSGICLTRPLRLMFQNEAPFYLARSATCVAAGTKSGTGSWFAPCDAAILRLWHCQPD